MTEKRRRQITVDYSMNQLNYDWHQNDGYEDYYKPCKFVTKDRKKWDDFVEQNKQEQNIAVLMKEEVWLKNKERWIWNRETESCGQRYYKVKVDRDVSDIFLNEIILPSCYQCCDFEWI